jgi:hypothetical protein
MSESQLREAYTLMKQGDKRGAASLIQGVLKDDRSNVNAWWLFSHVLEDEEKVVKSLEKVLALNPDHLGARKRLAQLRPEYAHLAATVSQTMPQVKGKAGVVGNESKKINMSGLITAFVVFVVVFIISFLFPVIKNMMDSASLANVEGPSPEEVALLQITAAFDGDYEMMRHYTCDSLEEEWMELLSDMTSELGSYGVNAKDVDFDFENWKLELEQDNGQQKIYSVTGDMVMHYQGQTVSLDIAEISGFEPRMILVVNDNHWVVCSL